MQTRQLGSESGVQLNPLQDNSEIASATTSDQRFAIAMRATRGRIDKPFVVNSSNATARLGFGESIRFSPLNEAWVHVIEALNNGAYEAVIHRLTTDSAAIKWAIAEVSGNDINWSVSTASPVGTYALAVRHLGCHNDGIKIEIHADKKSQAGVDVANDRINLRVLDSKNNSLYDFFGSLNPLAKDDYGVSIYLPDVIDRQTDEVELLVNATFSSIAPTFNCYGYDAYGRAKFALSALLICFDEGGTGYTLQNYMTARERLKYATVDYGYIASGGSQSSALLAQMAQLAFDRNKQFVFDVDGSLSVEAAIAFVEQAGLANSTNGHLLECYYTKFKSNDPTGINTHGFIGASTLNIAYRCARNAVKNLKGFSAKHFPVAGKNYPVSRQSMKQEQVLSDQERNALANARINPVMYHVYSGGGLFVFFDSLTLAPVDNSLKKLIAVSEMSTSIDEAVVRKCNDILQLPIGLAIKNITEFLKNYFESALSAGWLSDRVHTPYQFSVKANQARPYDVVDVRYSLIYEGTTRQIHVTQTLARP